MKKYLAIASAFIAAASLMLVATPAAARVNVDVMIGIPGVYVQPAPVYVHPQPVYVQPRPVYVQPYPTYVRPYPVFVDGRRAHRGHRHHGHRGHHRGHGRHHH